MDNEDVMQCYGGLMVQCADCGYCLLVGASARAKGSGLNAQKQDVVLSSATENNAKRGRRTAPPPPPNTHTHPAPKTNSSGTGSEDDNVRT